MQNLCQKCSDLDVQRKICFLEIGSFIARYNLDHALCGQVWHLCVVRF